jgi:hypothetical protein
MEVFLSKGFDDFISKPIDIRQLNAALNKYIRDKQTPEVLEEARRQKTVLYVSGKHSIAVDPQLAEFFVRDAEKAAFVLEAICKNNCRRTDDLPVFTINIHAMKSALSNIGEGDLAEKAAKLEEAGREQNVNLILSSLPGFLEELYAVIDKLKPSDDEEEEFYADEAGDAPFLHEKLLAIRTACGSFNKKAAKEALAELKKRSWSKQVRDRLSAIAEHLLHSEFEEVAKIAGETEFS